MTLDQTWLLQGYFQLDARHTRHTLTQGIRDELARSLGLTSKGLRIAQYPVAATYKHTFWWRMGNLDYAEAQFFAGISRDHPILSLGVSVEKGYETTRGLAKKPRPTQRMNRTSWDWPRLVRRAKALLGREVPKVEQALKRAVFLWIGTPAARKDERTYTCLSAKWYRRYTGPVPVSELVQHIESLDRRRELWVNLYIGCDFTPIEVHGKEPRDLAAILLAFNGIREAIHGRP